MKFIALLILFLTQNLFAHPHVFVDASFSAYIKEENLVKIDIKWVFDEMTSLYFINDFDIDKNGRFDKEEIAHLEEESFTGVKEYGYMSDVQINGKEVAVAGGSFKPEIKNNQMIYNFTLSVNQKVKKKDVIKIFCIDKDNYIAITLDEKKIKIDSDREYRSFTKEEDYEVYYGKAYYIEVE